jgi:transposase InsO family protein
MPKKTHGDSRPQPTSSRPLSAIERDKVRETLNSERFVDCSPRQVYSTLLDEEIYLCSVNTMYRILAKNQEVRERRNQKRHPVYTKPELVATAPNQVWTWDITNTSASLSTSLRRPVTHVPDYPDRFGGLIDARTWAQPFFDWYTQ